MRIAQVAPLFESVPPKLYGGTERIVSYLTEEFVAQGHDVTLFASGDSLTSATLVPCCEAALRLNRTTRDWVSYHIMMLEKVRRHASDFDIIHFHIDFLHYPLVHALQMNAVTTLHGRLDIPDLQPFYRTFHEARLISISDAQRRPMPPVNWVQTIYHGLPQNLLPFQPQPKGGYLAYLGRISPEKGPDRAIEIATQAGMKLKMAAKIDEIDECYWKNTIRPIIAHHPNVEFIGEINEKQKAEFLGNAYALLFPIDWPEPFGLVMIEAMACGTPVIAFQRGSVPEVIDEYRSGVIVNSVTEAVDALPDVLSFDRALVRACFEERFSAKRMAHEHLKLYRSLTKKDTEPCAQQFFESRPQPLRKSTKISA